MQNYVNEEEYFKYLDIIGLSATIIGALRFIPLVAEVYRSKKTNNFTYGTLLFAFTSTILWIIYSIMRKSISLGFSAGIAFCVYVYIFITKLRYG
tara:strand:+ start:1004 stop:1288 length:285 start_codon:yes stop_codon:yes gene_type:complete